MFRKYLETLTKAIETLRGGLIGAASKGLDTLVDLDARDHAWRVNVDARIQCSVPLLLRSAAKGVPS